MATVEGIGDILGGIGDVKPETVNLLHARERMGLEASRQKAIDDYYKSLIGQSSARMMLEQARLKIAERKANEPVYLGPGTFLAPSGPGQEAKQVTPWAPKEPKPIPYMSPGGARDAWLAKAPGIMQGPGTDEDKLRLHMQSGATAADAKAYMDTHKEATSLAKRAEVEYQKKAAGKPHDESIITAYNDFLRAGAGSRAAGVIEGKYEVRDLAAAIAAAVTAATTKAQGGTSFVEWEPQEKESAFLDKYYSGKDPRFAWGDRKSYTDFQKGYYGWLAQTGRSPLSAISERSDIRSLQGALNDITKREGLINSFVDRIEANAKVVKDLQAKYKFNVNGRLMNQAQNLLARGIMGSGDLESLRLALFSLSQEVTKVETGQLGIAAPSVTQSEELLKIHDINLNIEDLDKVINTSTRLGHTSKEAMRRTREDLLARIGTRGPNQTPSPGPIVSPQSQGMRPGDKAPEGVADGEYTVRGQRVRVKNGIIQ